MIHDVPNISSANISRRFCRSSVRQRSLLPAVDRRQLVGNGKDVLAAESWRPGCISGKPGLIGVSCLTDDQIWPETDRTWTDKPSILPSRLLEAPA